MELSMFAEKSRIFEGKAAVVTGGTSGIGRATALQLARWSCNVLIVGRHETTLGEALSALRAFGTKVAGVVADQASRADVGRVFQKVDSELGRLDFLINNAGIDVDELQAVGDEQIEYCVRSNLVGYLTCTRHALTRMQAGAHVVNVGSMSAEKAGPHGEIYTATKAGIRGFSTSLRRTLKERKIRVTLIEPGWVGTDMTDEEPEKQREAQRKNDLLKAEDIAASVAFCLAQPSRCDISSMQVLALMDD